MCYDYGCLNNTTRASGARNSGIALRIERFF